MNEVLKTNWGMRFVDDEGRFWRYNIYIHERRHVKELKVVV